MQLTVLEEKKHRLVFELKGADHSFSQALKAELWNDAHVKTSGYTVDHPLIGSPKFVVETDTSSEPKKALSAAVKRLDKILDKLKDQAKELK